MHITDRGSVRIRFEYHAALLFTPAWSGSAFERLLYPDMYAQADAGQRPHQICQVAAYRVAPVAMIDLAY